MTSQATRSVIRKRERLEARITQEQKQLLERAAALAGQSLTDFVISSAHRAAEETIREHEIIRLSPEDSSAFVEALLNPSGPNEHLRAACAAYLQVVDNPIH